VKLGYRRIAVAVVQRLIVLSLAGKYAFHRERLPRVWVKATAVDPNLPIRGRYVSLRLQVDGPPQATDGAWMPARVRPSSFPNTLQTHRAGPPVKSFRGR
jgi:hypothetical protein